MNLDAIVTLVDAKHFGQHIHDPVLDGRDNQAVNQVIAADRIIINKVDLVEESEIQMIEKDIRRLNETAEIIHRAMEKLRSG